MRRVAACAVTVLALALPLVLVLDSSPAAAGPAADPLTSFCSGDSSAAGAADLVPLGAAGLLESPAAEATVTGLAVDVVAPVAVAAASYCATTRFLHWAWGGSHVVETDGSVTATATTTMGAGCWSFNGWHADTNCSGGDTVAADWLYPDDGYTTTGSSPELTVLVVKAPTSGDDSISIRVAWSSALGTATAKLECAKVGGGTPTVNAAAVVGGGAAGSQTFSWAAGTCGAGYRPWFFQFVPGGSLTAVYQWNSQTVSSYGTPAPSHKLRFDTRCEDAAGTVTSQTSYSVTYKEADATLPPIDLAPCPSGSQPVERTVTEGDLSGAGGTQLFDWNSPDPLTSPYPDCLPGGAQVPCVMRLVQEPATGGQLTCGTAADCTAYSLQPDGSTALTEVVGTDTYACLWGTYSLPLVQCDAMGTSEGISTAPDTGTEADGSSPGLGIPPAGSPGTACFPSGWGLLNPVSWVYMPMMCALRDSFEPSDSSVATLTSLQSDAAGRAPFSVVTAASSWVGDVLGAGSSGTCDLGWTVSLGPLGHVSVLSCGDPIVGILRGYRTLVEIALFAGFFGPLAWWAWRQYAPGSQTG